MKIYFDNVEDLDFPNCTELSRSGDNTFWLTASGTRMKKELRQLNVPYYKLDDIDEPGLYFVEVNGDPIWWNGCCPPHGPRHIIHELPKKIIELIQSKKIKLIISADREGGPMIEYGEDCFLAMHQVMIEHNLPINSVLILQGNIKISQQYTDWLEVTNNQRLFEVKHSNHFDKIFILNNNLPTRPIIYESLQTINAKDFNSLNRTFKIHRSAHLYSLTTRDILHKGLVSFNEMQYDNVDPLTLIGIIHNGTDKWVKPQLIRDYDAVLKKNFPLYVDGNWEVANAANSFNIDIFKNSLISFVTETKFRDDVIFLTEKVFKCLAVGHPMIVLGPCGTLRALEDLGYRINICGLNPEYNDIEDHTRRFHATHNALHTWINFSLEQKKQNIQDSLCDIEHNFILAASRNLYHEGLIEVINTSTEYFK
jgi:hypothetical protein